MAFMEDPGKSGIGGGPKGPPRAPGIGGVANEALGNGPKPVETTTPSAKTLGQRAAWSERYGTTQPKGFDLPKVRIPGVNVNKDAYAYQGHEQSYWDDKAAGVQGRQAFQGDFGDAQAMRGQQLQQLQQAGQTRQMYMDAAMGQGPSLAQAQLQQGVDRGIAGQLAVANSARGSAAQRAGAMRGAQLQGQEMMGGLGAQSAALRAQEIATARSGLLGADAAMAQNMAGIRGQDVGQAGMNLQAQMANRAQNDTYAQALQGYGMNASGATTEGRRGAAAAQNQYDFETQKGNANLEKDKAAGDMQAGSQAGGAAAGAIAAGLGALAMFSDKRAKHKILEGDKDVDAFLKTLKPYSYEYKDKAHGTGKKTSVMAQDLEKTSLGETLVSRDKPTGLRKVDYAKALPVMLASMGRLSDRLEKAEARNARESK